MDLLFFRVGLLLYFLWCFSPSTLMAQRDFQAGFIVKNEGGYSFWRN
ncbi:hypothetical protein PEDI_35390 [Persicobacter diffluens]|uniref:Uncharacterized protein n=1 Tax=Persicobacter diffluens TaxID=981 RepID=A0AAN4W2A1_9BACT|nr:hypothetical protein PEDI_35390 [Persicobacter diffluens]